MYVALMYGMCVCMCVAWMNNVCVCVHGSMACVCMDV